VDVSAISDPAVPDYNYDVISGITYDIDISRPVGERITLYDVDPAARFVVAVNNYRRSGGGNFPGIVKEQVYNAQQEIRQLLIDWAQAKGVIDPADFFVANWRLVRAGVPVF
jgi:2',3'-cyclic-nucleotide 2'-phosphodiesterase/3'-nucleotidase